MGNFPRGGELDHGAHSRRLGQPINPARFADVVAGISAVRFRIDVAAADKLTCAIARRASLTPTSSSWAHHKAAQADAVAVAYYKLSADALVAETTIRELANDFVNLRTAT